jgi:hypothetical protein
MGGGSDTRQENRAEEVELTMVSEVRNKRLLENDESDLN